MNSTVFVIYPEASDSSSNIIPLGPLYLAESLLHAGYVVYIIDGSVDRILKSIRERIDKNTVALCISSMSGTQLKNSILISKELKRQYPPIPIIFGGAHATALPQQTLESNYFDYIVWGEGEISLPLLLKSIQYKTDPSLIKGIGYKIDGKVRITGRSGYTPLDRVFELPYHLVDMNKYRRKLIVGPHKNYYTITSRGCPFQCHFCSNSSNIWPNTKMRFHTIEHILHDVSVLIDTYEADGITIGDENFFINEPRVVDICNAFIQQGFHKKVKLRVSGRADLLSRLSLDTWNLLQEAGVIGIGVGIESGSQSSLNIMGKGITLEQIYRTDDLLTKFRFYKTYNFLTCIPGETIQDIKETLRLIINLAQTSKYCPYPFGLLHKYIPLPGTKLFHSAIQDYGFNQPKSIEGWTDFDFATFSQSISQVRPWLSGDLLRYVDQANQLIETLNNLFTGEDCDSGKIDTQIERIRSFIHSESKCNEKQ